MNPNIIRCYIQRQMHSVKSRVKCYKIRIPVMGRSLASTRAVYKVIEFLCTVWSYILFVNHIVPDGLKMSWLILVDKYIALVVVQQTMGHIFPFYFPLCTMMNCQRYILFGHQFNCFYRISSMSHLFLNQRLLKWFNRWFIVDSRFYFDGFSRELSVFCVCVWIRLCIYTFIAIWSLLTSHTPLPVFTNAKQKSVRNLNSAHSWKAL